MRNKINLTVAVFCGIACLVDIYLGMYGFAIVQAILSGLNYMCYKKRTK